jgi:2-dehydropantoate 2-reductase
VEALVAARAGAKFEAVASEQILLVMWEKWVFLASLAGITCLARAAVGDVVAAGGADLAALTSRTRRPFSRPSSAST